MSLYPLLHTIADGEFHSGEELARLLGVSRTAVWKQLQKIQLETGLPLESVKGRGYRLQQALELLDRDRVISEVGPLLAQLEVHEQIDSTNRLALQRAQEGCGRGHVVVAEQQTAGRGRRGRQWVSPFGRNIYCSAVWEFDGGAAALEGLSLAVGVAVAQALTAIGVRDVGLKWPNDVVWGGRKLAGILLEMVGDAAGRCQVVVGIGINVAMSVSAQTQQIDQPWVDVQTALGGAAAPDSASRNQLLAALLGQLLPTLQQFEREGFSALRAAWSALDSFNGRDVVVHLGERLVLGVAAGVSASGALLVDTDCGRQEFHGGEVSLRLAR
jgi:BirA family biotin operon repressor/biotin-[acetyl-CoA-carboxylase] ligase